MEETRSHFGAWCIVSSPLTLSLDVRNDTVMDAYWPIIANTEAIAINQAWAGHSGSPFAAASTGITYSWSDVEGTRRSFEVPLHQYFSKPLEWDGSRVAVLLMNLGTAAVDLDITFEEVPQLACDKALVRDVWTRTDLGIFQGSFTAAGVPPHDSAFLTLVCSE